MAKKLGCASCGGTMKKMKAGGTTKSVSISKPGAGVVKETKGDTNQKMGIYGIAQTGPTGPNDSGIATMKKGGAIKTLPKAQLGSIVKAFIKTAKPVTQNIIKDTKVAVRPVNRAAKPIAKKLDRKSADRFIINQNLAKLSKEDDKVTKKALKIATAIGASVPVGGFINSSINKSKADKKAKAKITPKKK
jgi:hypothetical protein